MKSKNFFVVAVLLILLSSIAYIALSPTARATEITNSQKATNILGNVVGLNMNVYTANLTSDVNTATNPVPAPPSIPSGLSQETLIYNLTSAQGSLRASVSFINSSLNQIYLSDYVGSPSINQPTTNTLDMAKEFLQRYQAYTGNSFYGSLSSMLDGVTLNTNTSDIVGNVKLQVSVFNNQTEQDIVWSYVDNNSIPALMKDIVLSYRDGHLESFLDNWQLYQINGVPTVSNQDAIATALEAAQNFSYTALNANGVNVTVSNFKVLTVFNVTMSYVNYYDQTPQQSTRGGDPYILYPSWSIGLGYDKVYPGGVTGLNVRVWADSGNVSSVEPIVFALPSSSSNIVSSPNDTTTQFETNNAPTNLILLPIVAVTASGLTVLYLYSNKNKLLGFKRTLRLSKRKLAALCLVILPIGVIMVSPIVQGATLKSEIYVGTYVVTSIDSQEYSYASNVASDIQALYQDVGTPSTNNYGSNTNYNNIMYNIMYDESNYMGVAVFHFGHGYVPNYIDSNDNSVSYSNIKSATNGYNEHYFVWMWTCTLAGINSTYDSIDKNFAYAWTQQSSLSTNGYGSADSTNHVFIGFQGESPTISEYSFYGYTQLAFGFIEDFYYYAIIDGYSVHNALNQASEEFFGVPYASSVLYTGYGTYWPGGYMGNQWIPMTYNSPGKMMVYGDSNVIIS